MDKEYFDSLTDEQKWYVYNGTQIHLKDCAETLTKIVCYLLGKDWYSIASDTFGCNREIFSAIQYKYRDVNLTIPARYKRLKEKIKSYFTRTPC